MGRRSKSLCSAEAVDIESLDGQVGVTVIGLLEIGRLVDVRGDRVVLRQSLSLERNRGTLVRGDNADRWRGIFACVGLVLRGRSQGVKLRTQKVTPMFTRRFGLFKKGLHSEFAGLIEGQQEHLPNGNRQQEKNQQRDVYADCKSHPRGGVRILILASFSRDAGSTFPTARVNHNKYRATPGGVP